ncbi:serine/threonine-protein kinase [Micromonospora sp. NPDC005254]|uniref:serine/threonine-protein kinase n=1 Tax=Micromonospora sp. NPDC005254 TaxID=3364229 RepID=UPI00367E46C3
MPERTLSGGRYRLDSPLAHGGMGEIWVGWDRKLDREIAVKFIRTPSGTPKPEHIRRFRREARITARLEHPGIATVYDFGTGDEDQPFLVMQRLHGITIADLVAEQGPLPVGWAAAIAAQVCAVLAAAHAASLIHRDLKPSNLMLTKDGCVKVLDFGLATAPTLADYSRITVTTDQLGTPAYMAPEQVEANLSEPATDLYALGCTLHEMLTGRHVFEGSLFTVLTRQVTTAPPAVREMRPEIPAELEQLVLQLLAKKPGDRPGGAEEVYSRLLPYADAAGLTSVLAPAPGPSPVERYAAAMVAVHSERAPSFAPARPANTHVTLADVAATRERADRLVGNGSYGQAAHLLRGMVSRAAGTFGSTKPEVLGIRRRLAEALYGGGAYQEAGPVYHALAADLTDDVRVFDCRLKSALCDASTGHTTRALLQLTDLVAGEEPRSPRSLLLRRQIGLLQLCAGQHAAAQESFGALLDDLRRPGQGRGQVEPDEIAGLLGSVKVDAVAADEDAWREVMRQADRSKPAMEYLLQDLVGRGLPAPVTGFELGDEGQRAELAWPAQKIAVLSGNPENEERDCAFRSARWDARPATDWTADELAARLG